MAAVRVVSSTGRLVSAFLCSYPVQLIVFGSIIASQSGAGWVEACNLIGWPNSVRSAGHLIGQLLIGWFVG
ncbi:hypothetical protein T02_15211 [Trichinella nativa]|uniref:Uncharacterized protein n=3 Tax=Trichinella TaxID=6333 RepID=A0A0V1L5Z8_9BILA|nr:hypothetical protein T02_15211 [Trichinella nativa]